MSRKIKLPEISREYPQSEINSLCEEMKNWFYEKEDNIFLDDFLLLKKKIPRNDVINLLYTNQKFKNAHKNALAIEQAKLQKFGAGDRLNASIVKQILINKHEWI